MRARFRATAALSFNEPLHRPAVGIPADTASSVHNGQPLDISQRLVAHITLKVTYAGRQITVDVTADGDGLVSHAGSALLAQVADKTGLTRALGFASASRGCGPAATTAGV